tara:strand:- start:1707 stop:2447 length:741 start_codon:yes stop_codon:yes gene_type:complete
LIFAIPDVWAQVNIENDRYYVGNDDTIHIVGEILNDSDKPLNQINIFTTLYSGDSIIHQTNSETLTNVIMPGMKGVFDIIITENIDGVDRYVLDLDYKITSPKSQVIEITSSELSYAQFDHIIIKGTVANNGDITANMVKVIGTLYDRDGNVAAVSQIRMEPDYIRANDESFFLITVPDGIQMDIVDYSLIAESEEYTTVPEFPFGSGALLIASLSAYIVLTKNPSAVTRSIFRVTNSIWRLNRFN